MDEPVERGSLPGREVIVWQQLLVNHEQIGLLAY
jgi:hypothetical protein